MAYNSELLISKVFWKLKVCMDPLFHVTLFVDPMYVFLNIGLFFTCFRRRKNLRQLRGLERLQK